MSWTDFLTNVKRFEQNAAVIFDEEEPIGRPTDLVMPRKRWFRRRPSKTNLPSSEVTERPKIS